MVKEMETKLEDDMTVESKLLWSPRNPEQKFIKQVNALEGDIISAADKRSNYFNTGSCILGVRQLTATLELQHPSTPIEASQWYGEACEVKMPPCS
uniref:Uncharacterized protein n=1 Tax=Sphaerodactylus townsendi TaxID=933632 RepID=A0ACB8FPR0_9SAUR